MYVIMDAFQVLNKRSLKANLQYQNFPISFLFKHQYFIINCFVKANYVLLKQQTADTIITN